MSDLFGNSLSEKPKTLEQDYRDYMRSRSWKIRRAAALGRAHYCCEGCGISKYSQRLEVHHRTYEHFKNEPPDDLIVLCNKCHEKEDVLRWIRDFELREAQKKGWRYMAIGEKWDKWIRLKYGPGLTVN